MKTPLLKKATKSSTTRNKITNKTFNLPMDEFLMEIYNNCTPNKYGQVIPKKIVNDMQGKIKELPSTLDRGDLHINYKSFFEGKISFRNMNGKYSITNIRTWQKLNYYILCFVDTQDNFTSYFFCIPPKALIDNPAIHLSDMNSLSKINKQHVFVGKRTAVAADDLMWLFKKHNLSKGTTYKHLLTFIKSNIKNR